MTNPLPPSTSAPAGHGALEWHAPTLVRIDERDLSVQLSGWMLLEAAARIAGGQPKDSEQG